MKTLEFAVKSLPEGKLNRYNIEAPPAEIDLVIDEVKFLEKVRGTLQLLRRAQEVYVKGHFSVMAEMDCRRCAERFPTRIEADIELQFFPTDELEPPNPFAGNLGERFYAGDMIDLSEDVRQALVLEIPIWFLCSESCRGLCPQCGENLNLAACNCALPERESSSPLAALADLLNQMNRNVGNGS